MNWRQYIFHLDLSKVARFGEHSRPRTPRGDAHLPGMVITYAPMEHPEDLPVFTPDRVKIQKTVRVTSNGHKVRRLLPLIMCLC